MRKFSVIALLFFASLQAFAQSEVKDFYFKVSLDPRLTSSNVASIGKLDSTHFSVAQLYVDAGNGQVKAIGESPSSIKAGAFTESYFRVSEHLAFHGLISYSYFYGKDMGGQILFDPSYNPVQFLESVDTTKGPKTSDVFHLNGGIIYTFNSKWSAGFEIDYQAGDMAKRRDPRFLNTLMNLNLNAGVYYSPSEKWSLGLALKYRNTSEGIYGKVYGEAGKTYYVSVDKGGYWGIIQMLDGDYNYVPTSTTFYMLNNFIGASFQADYTGSDFSIYNDLTFLYRKGDYGKHTSSTPIFFEYGGIDAAYDGTMMFPRANDLHRLKIHAQFKTLTNYENSFRYETPQGGSTKVVYTGQTKLSDRYDIIGGVEYDFLKDISGYRPRGEYGAFADFTMLSRHTEAFPYYRDNSTSCIDAGFKGRWNIFSGNNIFAPAAQILFHTGFGNPQTTASTLPAETMMTSFDDWLNEQFEYDTAVRAGAGLGFTYTRILNKRVSLDISVRDCYQHLLDSPHYLAGRYRNSASLTISCNF